MARNTKNSKKAATSQSSSKETAVPSKPAANVAPAQPQPTSSDAGVTPPTNTARRELQPTSWRLKLFLICIPLAQMLWNAEAPPRPFSAVRDPTTGLPIPELVDPKILLVTAEPSDLINFAPTVSSMLEEPRKSKADFYAISISGGKEDEKEAWGKALDLFGLEQDHREVLRSLYAKLLAMYRMFTYIVQRSERRWSLGSSCNREKRSALHPAA